MLVFLKTECVVLAVKHSVRLTAISPSTYYTDSIGKNSNSC